MGRKNKTKKKVTVNSQPKRERFIIPRVLVTPEVIEEMKNETLRYGSFETGGLLMGEKIVIENNYAVLIKKATGPGTMSQHSAHSFEPDVKFYQNEMKTELYRNGISYLGEWHKHPGTFNVPSQTDLNTMKEITREDATKDVIAVITTRPHMNGNGVLPEFVDTSFYYYQRGMENFVPITPEIYSMPPLKKNVKAIRKVNLSVEHILKLVQSKSLSLVTEGYLTDNGVINLVRGANNGRKVKVDLLFNSVSDETVEIQSENNVSVVVQIDKKEFKATGWQLNDMNGEFSEFDVEIIDLRESLFKRLGGLDVKENLQDKKAVLIGVGSVGSTAAAQLVKAGIGEIVMIDPDQLEIHNIIRHLCDLKDLGRNKTDAVSDKLKSINPDIKCTGFVLDFVNDFKKIQKEITDADILVVSTDTPDSRHFANMISVENNIPTVYISLHERAKTGRIYRVVPNETGCRHCLGDGQWNSEFIPGTTEYSEVTSERDIVFQPGLDTDISLVTLLGVKMIVSSLLHPKEIIAADLGANYILWNGYPGLDGSMVRLIPGGIPKNDKCDICGEAEEVELAQNSIKVKDLI